MLSHLAAANGDRVTTAPCTNGFAALPLRVVKLPAPQRPVLLVVVDTEEECDWSAGFHRNSTSVTAVGKVERVQRIFEDFGIRPIYVIDYPVAAQAASVKPLKEILDCGRAVIGAHLHPWVNPPFDEKVCPQNSYAGNLSRRLEAAKLRKLVERIERSMGTRPTAYKAGRYGFGPNTPAILQEQGFEVDLSANPPFDFGDDGGPDFSRHPVEPYWFGNSGGLLGIPSTGAYVGLMRRGAHQLHRLATNPSLAWAHLPGILSRLNIVDRLRLSPEGFTPQEHRKLTRHLLERGLRVFTFTFHSPSVEPGCTPYVRSEAQLRIFLDSCRRYFDFFMGELGGISMTPLELKQYLRVH